MLQLQLLVLGLAVDAVAAVVFADADLARSRQQC